MSGSGDYFQFVETYSLSSSYGGDFEYFLDEDGTEKVFQGNRDTDSVVWHCLNYLQARFVKLHVLTFNERAAIRWDLHADTDQAGL